MAAPCRLLKHSLASASTVANVLVRKYVDGLPLYRNLKKQLLESRVIYADETVVQVLKEDGKPASSESRMWVYGSGERDSRPIRFFEYQPDRSGKHARQVKAEPLLEAYWLWLKTLDPVPGSKLAEAVTYAQNQKRYLSAFLNHGEVDISNNFAESAIRPFAVGRKNWLFSDTVKGTQSSAIVYTLAETAKANGLEPYAYLLRRLKELPCLGRNPSQNDLNIFMPWQPAVQAACASSTPS